MKAEIPDRTYFKIGEVASILGVKPHIVRYWADEFPQIRLQKTKSGQRLFRRRDIEMLLGIDTLVNVQEYTVSGAKSRLKELRALGVKDKDLRSTIQRIGSVELMKRVVMGDTKVDDVAEPSDDATRASSNQETLGFLDENKPVHASPEWADERNRLLKQQNEQAERIDALERALKQAQTKIDEAKENDAPEPKSYTHDQEQQVRDAKAALLAKDQRIQELEHTLKNESDAYERRIALYKESVVDERKFFADEQKILTLYIEELEESLHQAREQRDERVQELEDKHRQECKAYERRIALYKQSVVEERNFFADEQKILTLYIEELEESLFKEKEEREKRVRELKALDTHANTLRTHVRTHAMQRRYVLRKLTRSAKQHADAHAHARTIARRLLKRVHDQRLRTGHETRDDSD